MCNFLGLELFRLFVKGDNFACVLVVNHHDFLEVVQELFIALAQDFDFYYDQANFDHDQVHAPA